MDQDSAHIVAASKVPMLKPGEFELWRMRIEQYIQMIDYALWEVIENDATLPKTSVVEGVEKVMHITSAKDKAQRRLEVKVRSTLMMSIPNEHQLKFSSIKDAKLLLKAVEKRFALQSIMLTLPNIDNLSDVVICSFFASQPNSPQLVHEDLQQIHPDDMEEMDLRWQMAMLTMRARRFLKNTGRKLTVNGNETIALVSCDGLGGYDWSDQAEEGPNYALMAYSSSSSDSEVSNDSNCSKSCMETVKLLKSQNDQLLRDLEKSSLMVLGYKTDEFENASIVLNKLIECQIVDNCKKGLGYENYNAVPPPYIGNFMPPTPDLSFIGLDEFVNKHVVENRKSDEEVSTGNPQIDLQDQGVIDSGCSRHMTGNMSYLTDYEEIDGGYVAFGGNLKGGKIIGKGTIKTGNLDFENVYFVRELKFNLFSVSQMCDKKNSVLFNDTECIVLSPNFKLIDESQVLLRVPRKNNMYSVDLKNIVSKRGLTFFFAKATSDESKLWHRRLGHLNFKTMNKLVKINLVRGLPFKLFENDQTCVACQKGKVAQSLL
ncbi:ribonuclease H-like domain-containing protein [Tanacetum coccineum]